MNTIEDKIELTELANKLFMYTDSRDWGKLRDEVFTSDVLFDMSSMGAGEATTLEAGQIGEMWDEGLRDLDAIHHQAGHYLITMEESTAAIFGYATAWHYKRSSAANSTRVFVGSYDLAAVRTPGGWRLSGFKYNLKFTQGDSNIP